LLLLPFSSWWVNVYVFVIYDWRDDVWWPWVGVDGLLFIWSCGDGPYLRISMTALLLVGHVFEDRFWMSTWHSLHHLSSPRHFGCQKTYPKSGAMFQDVFVPIEICHICFWSSHNLSLLAWRQPWNLTSCCLMCSTLCL
jgi:hypothetical protein